MGRFKAEIYPIEILLLLFATLSAIDGFSSIESSSCMVAYNEGGAPAVLESFKCAQWVPLIKSLKKSTKNCEFSSLQGHRKYQEDRVICNRDIRIPFLATGAEKYAIKEAKIDIFAVFDGHGGTEASEMAKDHFLDYFLVHVVAGSFKTQLPPTDLHDFKSGENETQNCLPGVETSHGPLLEFDDESLHEILKEALLGAIRDIDWKFSSEAYKKGYVAGSTASVALLMNNEELMVANLGDSKVLLCKGGSTTMLHAEELTSDHRADRDDERARIEAAGGFVSDWDVPRVNGILAVSRAIGDVFLKRYGVIAEPETAGWRRVTAQDRYLVVSTDGAFESLTPQNVCRTIVREKGVSDDTFPCLPSYSLANGVVRAALREGSTDNLSVVVVPLARTHGPQDGKDEL